MTSAVQIRQFQVNFYDEFGTRACDIGWPDASCCRWTESRQEGVTWYSTGELTEEGRVAILNHFGLMSLQARYPLDVLADKTPAELCRVRRGLEAKYSYPRMDIRSDRVGDHCEADEQMAIAA